MKTEKKCFSCQNKAPYTLKNSLLLHKNIYETTGVSFWFFKESENDKVKIADNESFNKILPKIKDNDGAEWRHISEFGNATNENVSKNIANAKPKAIKPKSQPKRVRKPLE